MIGKPVKFFKEAIAELKKVSWTSYKELKYSAWIVIISSVFLGIFIALTDVVLANMIGLIIK